MHECLLSSTMCDAQNDRKLFGDEGRSACTLCLLSSPFPCFCVGLCYTSSEIQKQKHKLAHVGDYEVCGFFSLEEGEGTHFSDSAAPLHILRLTTPFFFWSAFFSSTPNHHCFAIAYAHRAWCVRLPGRSASVIPTTR